MQVRASWHVGELQLTNERGIPSQFKRAFLHRSAGLRHEQFAYSRRAREQYLLDMLMRCSHFANIMHMPVRRHHIENTPRYARSLPQLRQRQRRIRRLRGRLQHNRTSRGDSTAQLSRDHGAWEIPRCEHAHDAHRLLNSNHPVSRRAARGGVAVRSLRLAGKPIEE